ncbi:RnfABCDGE type electron transport complex subunit D [Fictibacillus enclensis]|uniref:RnfABCDGE type electron transport complex subunit D n=1 Tax=Fictibacillus enclensis TaxID=1017270 RepID=UPI0025A00964|nr:RnfABCDGE type electron transport complex subunit D [Fictibacillus enclensis]MDM5335764.1 RnfABCDGE type electron transport complex subunit D [Fictibacillus enclensis]
MDKEPTEINSLTSKSGVTSWSDYKVDPRYFLLLFLALFFTAGQIYLGFFQTLDTMIVSVTCTTVTELVLVRLLYKKWKFPLSAVISGLGISLLLSSNALWPYALAAFLAMFFKFFIRFQGGHVFNPNNLALVIVLFFLPEFAVSTPKQWTNGLGVMVAILILGLFVSYLANRHDTALSFLFGFFIFGLIRHFFFEEPLWIAIGPIMGASLQLFSFYMITDPKTTPQSRKARIIFAIMVALIDAIFRNFSITNSQFYASFIISLLFTIPYRYYTKQKLTMRT